MTDLRFQLYVERTDPRRNMARFYALSIEPSLFGVSLVRRWGRIGTCGRARIETMESEGAALDRFLALLATKRKRGYRPPVRPGAAGSSALPPTK